MHTLYDPINKWSWRTRKQIIRNFLLILIFGAVVLTFFFLPPRSFLISTSLSFQTRVRHSKFPFQFGTSMLIFLIILICWLRIVHFFFAFLLAGSINFFCSIDFYLVKCWWLLLISSIQCWFLSRNFDFFWLIFICISIRHFAQQRWFFAALSLRGG